MDSIFRYFINPDKNYVDYLKYISDADLKSIFGEVEFEVEVDYKKFNNLENISQVAVINAFFVDPTSLKKKIGNIYYADRTIIFDILEKDCIWQSNVKAHLGQ